MCPRPSRPSLHDAWHSSSRSERIAPTAHYTGYVWARHGLGDPRLATGAGRVMYGMGQLLQGPAAQLGAPTLEQVLLTRHRVLDRLLDRAIGEGADTVVELAAGMSPRGLRISRAHPQVHYLEVDLPQMAARKRRALETLQGRASPLPESDQPPTSSLPEVLAGDVFSDDLDATFARLPRSRRVVVITEGLLNYFPRSAVEGLWTRLADVLTGFPAGRYLSDLHVRSAAGVLDRTFAWGLGLAVRGSIHLHYADEVEAERALLRCGFAAARLHAPADHADLPGMSTPGARRVCVIEASLGGPTTAHPGRRPGTTS